MATSTRAGTGFGRRDIHRIEGRLGREIRLAEYGEHKFPEKPLREYVTCVTKEAIATRIHCSIIPPVYHALIHVSLAMAW